jgi:hypothetical protein
VPSDAKEAVTRVAAGTSLTVESGGLVT